MGKYELREYVLSRYVFLVESIHDLLEKREQRFLTDEETVDLIKFAAELDVIKSVKNICKRRNRY